MDYSLLFDHPGGTVDGLIAEEFLYGDDHVTVGLRGRLWTVGDARWRDASTFSRDLRTYPDLLARVTPTDRAGAQDAYRRLAGAALPPEADLRATDHVLFAAAPLLRLGPPDGRYELHERRHYRVLFAKDFATEVRGDPPPPGSRTVGADRFSWQLRRVGARIAWALDVTVLLTGSDDSVGPVLRELTQAVRSHGLVPVTTERFA